MARIFNEDTIYHHYEINVALNGKHLFATAPRSIESESKLKEVLLVITDKFQAHEGYSVTVSAEVQYGRYLNKENTIKVVDQLRTERALKQIEEGKPCQI